MAAVAAEPVVAANVAASPNNRPWNTARESDSTREKLFETHEAQPILDFSERARSRLTSSSALFDSLTFQVPEDQGTSSRA